ncbi:hypothetical protein PV08_00916 [Exophiala spinifera]|uniref:Amidohydrolase-related domain-containing protein n=1 Tax=Exophiala spinifera TaxID=91928 RepID=A0A0D1YYH6_9EURO|nr:uncharacterized protein PV08_00916 [Exophiala spinifera]KIW20341.1 hypothetical protein PV08_00916 [Exophiala spinifera]
MGATVIHSVLLFDGVSTHPNATVTFDRESGRITSVSTTPTSSTHFPPGAAVIDGQGCTLLPGLIESHMHVHNLHLPPGASEDDILRSPLRCGVTTLKALVDTWPNVTVDNAAEFVKSHKANGADYIKLMQENCCSLAMPTGAIPVATLELQTAVVKAGHDAGFPVVGHALSVDMTEVVLKSGADGLTHTFVDQPLPSSTLDLYKKNNAFVIPTLTILASLTNELQDWRDRFADLAKQKKLVDDFSVQNMRETMNAKDEAAKLEYAFDAIKTFRQEGIDVVAGTDSVAGLKGSGLGPSLWMELLLYIEKCGMSVTEALHSATALPAMRFGFSDRGVVAEGKRADLVLVKGNVTEELAALWEGEGIVGVWKQGIKAS